MSENLKPCPRCGSAVQHFSKYVACASTECEVIGPNDDPYGAKWNALPRHTDALPRHTDAAPGMTDGELRSRVALVTCDSMSAHKFNKSCGLDAEWWNENSREVRAELDRRAALRNGDKP